MSATGARAGTRVVVRNCKLVPKQLVCYKTAQTNARYKYTHVNKRTGTQAHVFANASGKYYTRNGARTLS